MENRINGILIIDKPAGITSAGVVRRVKKLPWVKKAGHAGTLDPFATGVLVCCLNQATKLARFFLSEDKKYEAVLKLGAKTDTQDATGIITSTFSPLKVSEKRILSVFKKFSGPIDQLPPVYSALKYKGHSIIVLPQGITTFSSGFRKYYKQIIEGDVLVLSTFHPKAPWSVQLAMARNPIIYGLAKEIYVAESSNKGGTWSGVIDGLRKKRTIYVRMPEANEKNANLLLIRKGAKPVDMEGNILKYEVTEGNIDSHVAEPHAIDNGIENNILDLLKEGAYTSKEIVGILNLNWTAQELTNYLKARKDIIVIKGKPLKFTHAERAKKNAKQLSLFDSK